MIYHNSSDAELIEAYKRAIGRSAEGLKEAACIWCALKDRGRNMDDMQGPFVEHFPAIAAGRLLPEVIFTCGGSLKLVEVIAALVPEDQAKLARPGAEVQVLMPTGDVERRNPAELSITVAKQVLGDGRIRTPEEQRPFLVPQRQPQVSPKLQPEMIGCHRPFVVPPAPTGTALGAAFADAGYASPQAKLLQIGVDAWTKWPQAAGGGARRDFVKSHLRAELSWTLMEQCQAAALTHAIGWLLTEASQSIQDAAPAPRRQNVAGPAMHASGQNRC